MDDRSYLIKLTEAEQASTQIIRQAQDQRDQKLRQAKVDAEQELLKLRQEMEQEYQEAAQKSETGDAQLIAQQQEYKRQVDQVRSIYEGNKDQAMDFLMERVMTTNIKVPAVVIGKFE